LRLQAEVAQLSQDDEAALARIEESVRLAVEIADDLNAGVSWRVKGNILREQSKGNEAQNAYEMSLALIAQTDPYQRARTQTELARCLLQLGSAQPELAAATSVKALLNDALATFERLDTLGDIADVESLLSQIDHYQIDH